eukprot:CAMPEP_0113606914 /NCGR_PEP_ID=MMETSP0017_2-20120614/3108_1 /TAXON_ID=2856 /ORGANISM="Cylindrotheca closterium" /LENGTH=767 /DNA_ID=CAMNT_0000515489 /DNA_START=140 /DNA_END=2443 /DNA_ORIENTATION=+ /assembly_acc=CAM_ASM_000147
MPVIAPPTYEPKKAGGALENAAEEILNGIFCHYEPPTSTTAQKQAAKAIRNNPTKFLYEEQPIKLTPRKKVKTVTTPSSDFESAGSEYYESETDAGDYDEEASIAEEEADDLEEEQESVLKVETSSSKRGIKWRDEESKRREEEKATATVAGKWSQCMTLPCFGLDGNDIPGTLEDIHDENEVPQEPTPMAGATPTKSALKKRDDGVMKVLYDDQGNPNTTPRSPGSIKNHSFFRNVTNSPRAGAAGGMYEPMDYSKPSTPRATAFKMPRDFTPRAPRGPPAPPSNVGAPSPVAAEMASTPAPPSPAPPSPARHVPPSPARQVPIVPLNKAPIPGSPGVSEYDFAQSIAAPPQRVRQIGPLPGSPGITDQHGGPNVIRLAKVGRKQVTAPTEPVNVVIEPREAAWAPVNTAPPQQNWGGVDPAMAPTGNFVAKSPRSYMAPAAQPANNTAHIEEPAQISVVQAVQMLNKAGFNPGRRFNRGFNAKSFKKKTAAPPKSPSVQHHGYATANDNRDSFAGTRRVAAAPVPAAAPSQQNNNQAAFLKEIKNTRALQPRPELEVNIDMRDELEMARDPTPRQMKIQELEENLSSRNKPGHALPPTPRRKEGESEFGSRPTPTAQKPPQHFIPSASDSDKTSIRKNNRMEREIAVAAQPTKKKEVKKQEKVASTKAHVEEDKTLFRPSQSRSVTQSRPSSQSRPSQSRSSQSRPSQSRSSSQPKKEKKGFMSGIKKGFGKLKNTVNEIDSQRIAEPTNNSKKRSGSRREVRMA